MRSAEYGDIKMLFSYNGERYSGGTTYISLRTDEFGLLKPNGEPRDAGNPGNPRLAGGIPVSELLVCLRSYVVGRAEDRVRQGGEIDGAWVKELCGSASLAVQERLRAWGHGLGRGAGVRLGAQLEEMFESIETGGDGKQG